MRDLKKNIYTIGAAVMASLVLCLGQGAQASTVTLTTATQCSQNNASDGILVGDVTGNHGGASDCWGAFGGGPAGNDPGPGGGFQIGSTFFGFAAKIDFQPSGNVLSGADIGLGAVNGTSNDLGTWSFNQGAMSGDPFLIVVKKANNPGYGVWLFEGNDAASFSGTFSIAWKNSNDASHLSIYGSPAAAIPLPAGGILLLTALGGLGVAARRRRRKAL